jgi:hypothetical protein
VAQAIAAADAIERGLRRRDAEGLDTQRMGPVVTLMMGRVEDWLRVVVDRDGLTIDPDALPWSGVAVFKRAYGEFRTRGFRARLLGAAIRHHYHWSELIGGDVVITLPASWQRRFNASEVEVSRESRTRCRRRSLGGCGASTSSRRHTSPMGWASTHSTPTAQPLGRFERSSPRIKSCSHT